MRILALDASTTAVGWCKAQDGEYLDSGVYKPKGHNAWARIFDFGEWLESWWNREIDALVPDLLCYELATGAHGNMRTNRLLGAVEGVTYWIASTRVRIVTVTASQVRASGCHKHALAMASAIAGRDVTSPDEADAIGVLLAGWGKWQKERMK